MKNFLLWLINVYQNHISVWFASKNVHCKYHPTCSEYTKQAIQKYGAMRGSLKGFIRVLRCNPFSKGGYDPLK